eukprot:ctg_172.g105
MCEGSGAGNGGDEEANSGRRVALRIELTFRQVWLALYTAGPREAYQRALVGFIQAIAMAYVQGFSYTALRLELAKTESDLAEQAGEVLHQRIRLDDRERQTLNLWALMVYMVLEEERFPGRSAPAERLPPLQTELERSAAQLVQGVLMGVRNGLTLEGLLLEEALQGSGDADDPDQAVRLAATAAPELASASNGGGLDERQRIENVAASIKRQWMRLIYLTEAFVQRAKGKSG